MPEPTTKFRIPSLTDGEIEALSHNHAIDKVIQILVNKISVVVLTVGTLAAIAFTIRVLSQGWWINVILDISAYSLGVVVLLLKRHIPAVVVVSLLLVVAGILGITKIYLFGLGSIGLVALLAVCVITGAFFGFRVGAVFLAITVVSVALAAGLFQIGIISPMPGWDAYLNLLPTWISQIAAYVLFAFIGLVVVTFIQKRLWSSLEEIHQTSEALKEREKMYRLLTENMRDVLLFWNMEGRFTYISPSAFELLGYTVEEMLEMSVDDILASHSSTVWKERFQGYFGESGIERADIPLLEFEFVRRNGSRFVGELKSALIRNDTGELIGIQGILRDVNYRKQAEEEKQLLETRLRYSEKMQAIGQLAGGVAHDFNNQLAGIMGLADLLRNRFAADPKVSAYAEGIIAGVDRASDLTQKLLAFARRGKYQVSVIDVHLIIKEVITIVRRSLDKTIRIVERLEARPATIKGDPGQIQNALLNIAVNARDAMPKGGELCFSTRVEPARSLHSRPTRTTGSVPYLCIVISDTGVGMSPEVKQRVFEPFFTTKDPDKGTGMGLAAVYGTVKNHDGVIDVISEKGEGSTFRIFFPICEEPVDEQAPEVPDAPVSGMGNVLVVDDESGVLGMTTEILAQLGYTVRGCSTGAEALAVYKDTWRTTDLVILDLILPEISGQDVFHAIRKINPGVKIVLCSGYSIDASVQALLNDSLTEFIAKPFTMGVFSRIVARLLSPAGSLP